MNDGNAVTSDDTVRSRLAKRFIYAYGHEKRHGIQRLGTPQREDRESWGDHRVHRHSEREHTSSTSRHNMVAAAPVATHTRQLQ